jgi:chromosome segregation ATPase
VKEIKDAIKRKDDGITGLKGQLEDVISRVDTMAAEHEDIKKQAAESDKRVESLESLLKNIASWQTSAGPILQSLIQKVGIRPQGPGQKPGQGQGRMSA